MAKFNPKKVAKERKSLAQKLTEELEDKGVVFFQPSEIENGNLNIDNEYLSLPRDLTEIPSKYLGNYLNAFTQQKAYMRTLYSWQEINVEESKRAYFDIYFGVYKELTDEHPKMAEKSKDIQCNNDEEVHPLYMTYRDSEMKLGMIKSTIESLEECVFLISREISRRGADFNESARIDNIHRQ